MSQPAELDPDHLYICQHCCKSPLLKSIASQPFPSQQCVLCDRSIEKGAHTSDLEFVKAVKASILYHHADNEFDEEYGGESLQYFVSGTNHFFETPGRLDAYGEESFALSILDRFDEVIDVKIWFETFLPAIKFGKHKLMQTVTKELAVHNHFIVEERHQDQLSALKPHVQVSIPAEAVFYRARIGSKIRAEDFDLNTKKRTYYHEPYHEGEIGAPPVNTCSAGRLNRPGVSVLYLGSTENVAISEVRPHPGEFVSVAQFKSTRDLLVADFTQHDLALMYSTDELLDLLRLKITIELALAAMAPPSDQKIYSTTQFVGQVFRRLGFDGILYPSTVADGVNLAIFDPALCVWVKDSSKVRSVKRVEYSYEAADQYDPAETYDNNYDEAEKRKLEKALERAREKEAERRATYTFSDEDVPF